MTRGQADDVVQHVLRDPGILKVVLRRSNRLKTFVSQTVAEQTDQWEAYEDDAPEPRAPKVRIEVSALRAHAKLNDAFYDGLTSELRGGGQPHLEVRYEDLEDTAEHVRMLTFLGLDPPHPGLSAASVKQNDRDLKAVIANFEELDGALKGTEYHAELHDTNN
jgi:LPS sulfotransferase NodH